MNSKSFIKTASCVAVFVFSNSATCTTLSLLDATGSFIGNTESAPSAYAELESLAADGDMWAATLAGIYHELLDEHVRDRSTGEPMLEYKRALVKQMLRSERPSWLPSNEIYKFDLLKKSLANQTHAAHVFKALAYYSDAAESDIPYAMYRLGTMYRRGDGVRVSGEEAARLYGASAEAGCAEAKADLAGLMLSGIGITADIEQGKSILKELADSGFARAYVQLASTESDPSAAFDLNMKAAQLGYVGGMRNVGLAKLSGYGTESNYAESKKWLEAAAELHDASSIYTLGQMYSNGWGVHQDYEKAYEYFQSAWKYGYIDSAVRIGYYYRYGNGPVQQDYQKASWWMDQATEYNFDGGWIATAHLIEEGVYRDTPSSLPLATYCAIRGIADSFSYNDAYRKNANEMLERWYGPSFAATNSQANGRLCTSCNGTGTTGIGNQGVGSNALKPQNRCWTCGGSGRVR